MATIANQISRISNATDLLRKKGSTGAEGIIGLNLVVPAGSYWDKDTKTYVQQMATSLGPNDQIDKIAAAFCNMNTEINKEILVPIKISTDGNVTIAEGTALETGFYSGAKIKPYVEVDTDVVLNVEEIKNRVLTAKSATILPDAGYNYISSLEYTVQTGAIQTSAVSFGDDFVVVKASTSGWIDTNDAPVSVSVTKSSMSSKVGSEATKTLNSGAEIVPSALGDTTLTITKGIFGSDRTLTVKSVKSQTSGTALKDDILSGKTAWVDGNKVTGSMPNHGGESTSAEKNTAAVGIENIGGKLAITPELGYYNTYSNIITTIVYNPERVFGTGANSATVTEPMTSKVYYETIPAGYYENEILRKIEVQSGDGEVNIDYDNHTATFNVTKAGWIANNVSVDISAGPALYKQAQADLEIASHKFKITPALDSDGTKTSYLTEVTVDNTIIFDLLSAI